MRKTHPLNSQIRDINTIINALQHNNPILTVDLNTDENGRNIGNNRNEGSNANPLRTVDRALEIARENSSVTIALRQNRNGGDITYNWLNTYYKNLFISFIPVVVDSDNNHTFLGNAPPSDSAPGYNLSLNLADPNTGNILPYANSQVAGLSFPSTGHIFFNSININLASNRNIAGEPADITGHFTCNNFMNLILNECTVNGTANSADLMYRRAGVIFLHANNTKLVNTTNKLLQGVSGSGTADLASHGVISRTPVPV